MENSVVQRLYVKFLYSSELENIKDMSEFLDACDLSNLNQDKGNNLCEPTAIDIDSVSKNVLVIRKPRARWIRHRILPIPSTEN